MKTDDTPEADSSPWTLLAPSRLMSLKKLPYTGSCLQLTDSCLTGVHANLNVMSLYISV